MTQPFCLRAFRAHTHTIKKRKIIKLLIPEKRCTLECNVTLDEICESCVRCLPVLPVKLFPVTCEFIKGEKQFYHRAQQFYQDVPASEEGMLGDFVEISDVDLEGSRNFLKRFVVSSLERISI